jgi:hypothetical protein
MASFLLVGITTMAVGFGIAGSGNGAEPALAGSSDGLAYIETNNGEAFVVDDQQSDAELYEAALDELRQAFSESAGENSGDSGYIHTTWDGGATDSQIR